MVRNTSHCELEKLYTYNVLLSSPSDLEHERELIRRHVERVVNQIVGQWACIRLNVISWETDSRIGTSTSVQDVIDSTIPPYDIYLGLLWRKIGTPTKGSDSGTIYEYERGMALKDEGKVHDVMFYFKENEANSKDQSITDLQELVKVKQFKARLESENVLYSQFGTDLELINLLTIHLVSLCSALASKLALPEISETEREKRLSELKTEAIEAIQVWGETNADFKALEADMKDELVLAIRSEFGTNDKTVIDLNRFAAMLINAVKNFLVGTIRLHQKQSESLSRHVCCFTEIIAMAQLKGNANAQDNIRHTLKSLQPIKKAYADNVETEQMQIFYPLVSFLVVTLVPEADRHSSELGTKLMELEAIVNLAIESRASSARTCLSIIATLEALLQEQSERFRNSAILRLKPTLGSREVITSE